MHNQSHQNYHAPSNITVAFLLNFSFTVIEFIGGFLTNSMAILSDAMHDLGDTFSLGFSWYMEKISRKKRDKYFSYGYKRFSLLAALINSIVLVVGSILILVEAVPRLFAPEEVHAQGMLYLAILGVIINGAAVLRLRKGKTMNEKVVSWHLLEDVLGWIAVLIVSVVIMFKDLYILDPLFSVVFTLYILWNVIRNFKHTMMIFLQSIPAEIDISSIEEKITALPEVKEVHDTHVWSLDGEHHVLTTHIVVADELSKEKVAALKQSVREIVSRFEIGHATIEFEREGETCFLKDC